MSSFDIVKKPKTSQSAKPMRFDTVKQNIKNQQSAALKGYLLNNNIKKDSEEDSFDYILQSSIDTNSLPFETNIEKNAFDVKKAIKPVAIAAGATILGVLGISAFVKKYSSYIANNKGVVRPPDVPRSINVVEEPDLAMYKLLRDPSFKNFLGLIAVGGFSILTLSAKTLVDGAKDVWIKKQNCDIDYDLQENLIEVEKDSFSGKLNVVNTLLNDSANYFRNSLNGNKQDIEFKQFLSFKGEKSEDTEKKSKINPIIYAIAAAVGFSSILFLVFKNYQKTATNFEKYLNKMEDAIIKKDIADAQKIPDKQKAIEKLMDIFKSINASEKSAREYLGKVEGISQEEIDKTVSQLKKEQIFAQAPEALGGVAEKIQYYCYINQPRGHLYNWVLNPENDWNKYLFLSLSLVSSIGYLANAAADAVKQVAVARENSKSELNLRKRLVAVEINNFKAKKLSAINPMIDNFKFQKEKGKSKEELTALAQNILLEIKNGPPYIYN